MQNLQPFPPMIHQSRLLLETIFSDLGFNATHSTALAQITLVGSILLLSLMLVWALNRFLVPVVTKIVEKTPTKWDDYLVNGPVLRSLCRLLPGMLVYSLLPLCFDSYDGLVFTILNRFTQAYISISAVLLVGTFLKNITAVAGNVLREHHLVGILQFIRVLNVSFGVIITVSLLLGYNPVRVIAGLGAAATVLMLVFKDTILGLVAGIQLSANHMMKVGDWITLPKLNVNGTVEEMSLTTVKVRNFDNTISTVPPYTLVSDSFQNWNAMQESGRRRVKRALYIDVKSVRFCSEEELDKLNHKKLIFKEDIKSRKITNLTLFRHWLTHSLAENAKVADNQWILARQLEPTPNGLPLELWFYLCETRFEPFEDQASTLIEQFIATLPEFGLRLFQSPTGNDLQNILPRTKQA